MSRIKAPPISKPVPRGPVVVAVDEMVVRAHLTGVYRFARNGDVINVELRAHEDTVVHLDLKPLGQVQIRHGIEIGMLPARQRLAGQR